MKTVLKAGSRSLAVLFASAALCSPVFAGAGPPPMPNCDVVPEIDPGSAAGAMTLLVGGLMTLVDRRRSK